jgi:hypothetical protein
MNEDSIVKLSNELRAMADVGEDVPTLLKHVQKSFGRRDCKLVSIQCFHQAFGGDISSVSPIAGWCGFGGELSDDQVNTHVLPVLEQYRRSEQKS